MDQQFALFLQDLSALIAKHLGTQAQAQAQAKTAKAAAATSDAAAHAAAATAAAAAPAPAAMPVMPIEQFRQEAINLLGRHGGNQAPVGKVLQTFGLERPDQLSDEQRAPFIAALKAEFGEVA
jgi:hypothetical protein